MNDKHLTESLRQDYAAGKLSEEQADAYEEHLLTCAKCYETYCVDLPQERALQAFAREHAPTARQVFADRRGKTLKVKLTKVAEALQSGADDVRAKLEGFLDGMRLATLYPQVASVRGSDSTSVAIDQICRDFVTFAGLPGAPPGQPAEIEFKSRTRFLVHYIREKNVLRIQLPEGAQGQLTRISILKGDTEEQVGVIGAQDDARTFDIPLDVLGADVTLSWS